MGLGVSMLDFSCVFLCGAVPCCDVRYDFRMETKTLVRFYLQFFVGGLMSC